MREQLVFWMPWLISLVTIYVTWLTGHKHKASWLVGLANQALWLIWILLSKSYGLLPLNIALWIMYTKNHFKWNPTVKVEQK